MLFDRMVRAAKLDVSLYNEVEQDVNATSQALLVVVIVAVLSGIGAISGGVGGFVFGLIAALVGWAIWSFIMYLVGTTIFKGTATYSELLRCVGFANTPNALAILGFIPGIGGLIVFLASIWALVAMVIGVREALDITTGQAVITAIIGFAVVFVLSFVVAGIVGLGAATVGGL